MEFCGQMIVKHKIKGPPILAAFQKKPRNLLDMHTHSLGPTIKEINCQHQKTQVTVALNLATPLNWA